MEDTFIKPGNQERGWNDPPQFSYGLQTAHGSRRNILAKRAAPSLVNGPRPLPSAPTSHSPQAPPQSGVSLPPQHQAPPPPRMLMSTPAQGPVMGQKDPGNSQSVSEPDVEGVVSVLTWALNACRRGVPVQVCDDMAKRLHLLEANWRSGRLSLPVRRRMETLAQELQSGHWDVADEIHRSLMVDHVTEVSQWMVGVKRLIAETRNLSPELLGPPPNPEKAVQSPDEPTQGSEEPIQSLDHTIVSHS
ncbi:steroid receptor RNA activator 1 [Lampris incognitus]|uniref:steroid receptor RNA activator 1 n=1 Tax=Lampris incognitus TaxID=2546036 RepID=UPI0024B485D5|nr:steroid receptor RNA activator 1 [Lampris incognitus]